MAASNPIGALSPPGVMASLARRKTMSAENTNCLEGMACPECGYTERFKIIALTTATIAR